MAWLDAEKVWLNHSEGFSAGRLIKKKNESQDDSTCLVKLDHGGQTIEIEEEQISKVNKLFSMINDEIKIFRFSVILKARFNLQPH